MNDRGPIATNRLRLQPLSPDDAEEMAGVLNDPALYRFIGGEPPTVSELRELYASWVAGPARDGDDWHNWSVRLADGTPIGHMQATVLERGISADVAWIVGSPWQGRGYATEAAKAVVEWLEAQGIGTITAHVNPRHAASERVAEHAGFVRTDLVEGGEVVWRRVVGAGLSDET